MDEDFQILISVIGSPLSKKRVYHCYHSESLLLRASLQNASLAVYDLTDSQILSLVLVSHVMALVNRGGGTCRRMIRRLGRHFPLVLKGAVSPLLLYG